MIAGQRAYEASSKTIKTSDEMLQMANNVKA
jgi:flagellar hook protein FlgE